MYKSDRKGQNEVQKGIYTDAYTDLQFPIRLFFDFLISTPTFSPFDFFLYFDYTKYPDLDCTITTHAHQDMTNANIGV